MKTCWNTPKQYTNQELFEWYIICVQKPMEGRDKPIDQKTPLKNRAQTNHLTLTVNSAMKTEDKAKELYITRKLLK